MRNTEVVHRHSEIFPTGDVCIKKTIGSEERKLSVVKFLQFSAQCSILQPSRANAIECSIMAVDFAAN
jgi:hypothetical protein